MCQPKNYLLSVVPSLAFFRRCRFGIVALGVAAVAVSLLLGASPAQAQTPITWSSTAASTDWGTGGNWVGGVAPANNLTSNIAVFDSTSYLNQPAVNSGAIAGLVIGDGTTATAVVNINDYGNALNIGASGITVNANAGALNLLNTTWLQLGASQTWTNDSSNAVTAYGITNPTAGLVTLTLSGSGSGGYAIGSGWGGVGITDAYPWAANVASPTAMVVNMTGAGVVTISGNVNTTGGLTIQAGTVNNVGANSATPNGTGPITLGGGSANATLNVAAPWWTAATVPGNIVAAGGSTGTLAINTANVRNNPGDPGATYSGNITLDSDLTLTNGTVPNGSQIWLTTFSGAVSGSHNLIIGAANVGTVVLSGASPSFTGNMVVNNGTLMLTGATGPAGLAMNGGTFNYAPIGPSSQTLGALTFGGGDSAVQCTNDGSSAALTFASVARSSGATGNFVLSGAGASSIAITGQTPDSFIDPGVFFGGGTTAASYAYYDVGGFVRAINYGVDPNTVSVVGGGATIGTVNGIAPFSNVLVDNNSITAQTSETISTLQLGTDNFALASGATLTVNGILKAGNSGGGTISGGTGLQPASGADLVVRTDMANDSLIISSPILANGSNALVKSGAGTLTVSGANSLTGGLFINGGTFIAGSDASLGAAGTGVTINGGTFAFQSGYSGGYSISRPITVGVAGATFETLAYWSLPTINVASNITGSGPLTITTDAWRVGKAAFSGDNSAFSGGITQIGYGGQGQNVLEFRGANSTGTGPVSFGPGYSSTNLNLLADTNTTFLTSNVNPGGQNNFYVNVDQLASGTGNTLTLNMVTANNDTFNITGGHGYNLGIATLNMPAYQSATLNPTTANVAIGMVSGTVGYYSGSPTLTLAGTAIGNTIGSINVGGPNGNGQGVTVSSGVWTITGPGSYVAPTIVNGGTLVLANTTGSATGSADVTLNGGQLASPPGTAGIISGSLIGGSGAHSVSPGGDGAIGALSVGGLTLNGNSTLRFDITSSSVHDQVNDAGALSVASGLAAIQVPAGLSPGSYKLINFGSTSVTPSNFNVDFFGGGPAPSSYSLNVTGSELDLTVAAPLNNTKLALSSTSVSIRTMVNQSATASVNLSETSGTDISNFLATANPAVTVSPSSGTVATASGSVPLTIGLADYSTVGAHNGVVGVANNSNGTDPFNTGGNQIAVTGAVVTDRVVTASLLQGGIHAGVGSLGAQAAFTLSTSGSDNSYTRVTVPNTSTPDGNGMIVTGGANPTFNSPSVTDSRFLTSTTPLTLGGFVIGSVTLATSGEGLAGEAPIPVSVPYALTVFSGNANWADQTGGQWYLPAAWGNDNNWTDALSSAGLGAPGLSGAVSINDQANFIGAGFVYGTNEGEVDLNNVSPHLAVVNFAGSGQYTIGQGTGTGALHLNDGGSIQVSATNNGWSYVKVPVVLDGTTASFVNYGNGILSINLSGPVSGGTTGATVLTLDGTNNLGWAPDTVSGNISNGAATSLAVVKNGPGLWKLSGSNSYTGGTTVNNGVLQLAGSGTFSGGITVNASCMLLVDSSDANLGAASNPVNLNGGAIRFLNGNNGTPIVTNPARNFVIGSAGGMINSQDNNGANLNTIGGNISGSGLLTLAGYWDYNGTNVVLAGNNSGLSGGINVPNGGAVLTLSGSASSGTGPISFTNQFVTSTLNLRSDGSCTFSTSSVAFANWNTGNISVDHATTGSGNTLTLNSVTTGNVGTLNITGSNGYSLAIGTITPSADLTLNPTTANVAVGSITGSPGYYNSITLTGSTAGNSIGTIATTGGGQYGGSLQVTGGTWALTGASTYTMPTNVSGGMLKAAAANALPAGTIVGVTGGVLDVSSYPQTINALTMGPLGTLNLSVTSLLTTSGPAAFDGTLNLFNLGSLTSGTTELMSYSGYPTGTFASSNTPTGFSLEYNFGQLDIVGGSPAFSGSGTWISTSGATWSNSSSWTDGTVSGVPGDGSRAGNTDTATFNGSGTVAGNITLDINPSLAALSFSTSNYNLTGGSVTMQSATGPSTVTVASGAQAISSAVQIAGGNLAVNLSGGGSLGVSGNIADDNGNRSLTLGGDGSGRLLLSGTNSYGGGTTVTSGKIAVTNASSLGAAGGGLSIGAATLEVAGSFGDSRNITLTDPNALIQVDASFAYSNSGTLSGTAGLTLAGPGTLILSGSGAYGPTTTVESGTLVITNNTALPGGSSLTVGAGGTFVYDPNGATNNVAMPQVSRASAVEAVPEPGTLALLLVAALGSAAITYRRFRRA